ncbi:MAG: phosphoenolpyruvate--protein phosphotransferase [Magnetovibrio sp.]|nr:phosphoenolpyruvate--protein phosphotransferase [Magnetovibrio sp.]
MAEERQFTGLGVSPGIAIGPVYIRETGGLEVPEMSIRKADVGAEKERLQKAVSLAQRQVRRLQSRTKSMPGRASEELGFLLEAYQQMLKDSRLVRGAAGRIKDERVNAEAAVQREMSEITATFQAMDDTYIAARLEDIREVGNRIIRNLTRKPLPAFSTAAKGSIIMTDQLTPADMAQVDPSLIAGAASELGGAEGHAAIMARALALPMVLGVHGILQGTSPGDTVIIDGSAGRVVINPTGKTLAAYQRRRESHNRETRRLSSLRSQPAMSRDGTGYVLQANVDLPMEMPMVAQAGAEGIGLLRSEFMFMNRTEPPGEDEQYGVFRDIVQAMKGKPVTIRSLDVGADKPAEAVTSDFGDTAASALGLRGIRLALMQTDILETQFRAMLRAAADGPVRILLPMVSTPSEVMKARDLLKKSATRLKRRKIKVPDPLPPLGAMIEVPGAALAADALAQASDFFAIGSNDLTMYTLATDRANEHVAHLFDPLHPAVLRLIQFSTGAALRARIPISICGEMAGDPRYTALLLGLGLRELSMSPAAIPRVKQRIREMDAVAAAARANLIMDQTDAGRIAILLDDFNALA